MFGWLCQFSAIVKWNLLKTWVTRTETSTPVDAEVIHFFVQLSRAIGLRPTVGEIYRLLFMAPTPLTFDAEQLQGEAREHILARIKLLKTWEENASRMLPFLSNALANQ